MREIGRSQLLTIIFFTTLLGLIVFSSFYTYWNSTPAERTCASCHVINPSVFSFRESAHRDLTCKECHGTALSNGFHSLKEKSMMIVNHIRDVNTENVRMNESQLLEVMNNCKRCHASEYAKWESGGHSANYMDIFLNEEHNQTEQLNSDCLRCHGMFNDGTIEDLVEPLSVTGPWKLKNKKLLDLPTMPCFACHAIHIEGDPLTKNPDYKNPSNTFYERNSRNKSRVTFYDRFEKLHFSSDELPQLSLNHNNDTIKVSNDFSMRNCIQCHAPNSFHKAGTSDDRTPRGVHEGLSCIACHDPHSNDATNSCISCHPSISNCNLDVTEMNTTYTDPTSPNNIHFVSCNDCHKDDGVNILLRNN